MKKLKHLKTFETLSQNYYQTDYYTISFVDRLSKQEISKMYDHFTVMDLIEHDAVDLKYSMVDELIPPIIFTHWERASEQIKGFITSEFEPIEIHFNDFHEFLEMESDQTPLH